MVGSMNQRWVTVFALVLFILGIYGQSFAASKNAKPTVAVVNYPLKYLAERIAGDRVNVVFPIPPGVDPAFWAPEPKGVLSYQRADLVLLNGATYGKWLDKVSLAWRKLVNTSESFKDRYIAVRERATHSHGPEGAHAHFGTAFTTWLDFQQAAQQAKAVRMAFDKLIPDGKQQFAANFKSLEADLLALDRKIEVLVQGKQAHPLVASHPVYDYFARRYRLSIRSVLWEPDQFPTDKQWVAVKELLKGHPAKWMVWESDPNPRTIERLKSIGVESLVFDPCGNVPSQGDFLSVMRRNVTNLEAALALH